MKNLVLKFCALSVLFIAIGCVKSSVVEIEEELILEPVQVDNRAPDDPVYLQITRRIFYENRRHDNTNWGCTREPGICGPCWGICIGLSFRLGQPGEGPPTPDEVFDGVGSTFLSMDVYEDNSAVLYAEFENNVDNGDGLLYISKEFNAGDEVSAEFGYAAVNILPGIYQIDYSESTSGKVSFNAIVVE